MNGAAAPETPGELLAAIETLLARRGRLAFPTWLTSRFEADTGARCAHLLSQDLRRSAIYYNLFLLGDVLLTPDTVGLALALHALVVTPALLFIARLCRRGVDPAWRDALSALAPLLISGQVLWVFAASASPMAAHYLFFVTLNALTVNTAMRLRNRASLAATVATFLALIATLAVTHKLPVQVAVMQGFSYAVCGLVTLRGAADREREFRRAYLIGLRDKLRIAATDAEANRDTLPGAANRRGLETAARAAWADAATPVAAVLFDVDRFKAFNDLYGHLAGDACLRAIGGGAVGALAGREALLARFGGEEFLALLTGAAAEHAEEIAETLRRAVLALDIVHSGAPECGGVVSASFGVARGVTGEMSFEALVAAADVALYRAKSAGRNKVSLALAA